MLPFVIAYYIVSLNKLNNKKKILTKKKRIRIRKYRKYRKYSY